jgi:hypothetical protein
MRFGETTQFATLVDVGSSRQIGSEQLVVVRVGRGGGPGSHAELGKDVTHVSVNRSLAHEQFGCDGLVGLACGNLPKNLKLA